jgi:hypothetical protein
VAYAHVLSDGSLDAAHSKNVTVTGHPNPAGYCLAVSAPFSVAAGAGDAGNTGGNNVTISPVIASQDPGGRVGMLCPGGSNVLVGTWSQAGGATSAAFWITFN